MKLLIAEDDVLFQKTLSQMLGGEYDIVLACSGNEAWEILQSHDAPRLAILDWVMPGLTGPEICRKVRASERLRSMYLLIVTSKNNEADIVSGLRAGADDYITKPPVAAELRARLRVGERVLSLQNALELQDTSNVFLYADPDVVPTSASELSINRGATGEPRSISAYTPREFPAPNAAPEFTITALLRELPTLQSKG